MFRTIMSSVRDDLRLIFDNSVNAVKPNELIKKFIEFKENQLLIKNYSQNVVKNVLLHNRDIYILGAGKAVLKMSEEFLNQFDVFANNSEIRQKPNIRNGLLSVPIGSTSESNLFSKYKIRYKSGALHNMPDNNSLNTTKEMVDLIELIKTKSLTLDTKPLIISFISGGGSALLSLPKNGITLDQKCCLISELVKSGATIDQLNTVRQCLSRVKSGKLAKLAISPPNSVEMLCFLMSDIIGDPIDLIASGPTVVSTTYSTKVSQKSFEILNKLNVKISDDIKNVIQSEDNESNESIPKDLLNNIIIGNNSIALNVAQNTARHLGYKVMFLGNAIKGEARLIAKDILEDALKYKPTEEELKTFKGICWVGGGETTVHMNDSKIGLGGRCQEMGLAFYRNTIEKHLEEKLYFLCAGTDGQDGPTDVAGVIAESVDKHNITQEITDQMNDCLKNHNSYEFFRRFYNNWFVKTGITGTNVMDIYCLIKTFY